jgi:hypothetical protein
MRATKMAVRGRAPKGAKRPTGMGHRKMQPAVVVFLPRQGLSIAQTLSSRSIPPFRPERCYSATHAHSPRGNDSDLLLWGIQP